MDSNDSQETSQKTFKPQLDQAAVEHREREQPPKPNPIVEKITEYVPAISKMLPKKDEKPAPSQPEVPGPPERPDDDHKIVEFVRDQHRSHQAGGDLSTVAADK